MIEHRCGMDALPIHSCHLLRVHLVIYLKMVLLLSCLLNQLALAW